MKRWNPACTYVGFATIVRKKFKRTKTNDRKKEPTANKYCFEY